MSTSMRTFYTILITQTVSMLGSTMSAFAVGVWVFQRTGEATPLAMVAMFAVLPAIFTTGISGVLADRYDRRWLMIGADAGQAGASVLLLISIVSGEFQLWHLYGVAILEAIFGSFQFPALMASITMLVPDAKRDRANALQQLAGPSAGILSPIIGALLLVAVGVEGVIVIDLATFALAVAVIASVTIPRPVASAEAEEHRSNIWRESLVGFKFLWQKRPLFTLMMLGMLINIPLRVIMVLNTPYILSRTGSELALGTLSAVASAGALIGAIGFSVVGGSRSRVKTIFGVMTFAGLGYVLYGMAQAPILLGLIMFVTMLPISAVDASLFSIVQSKVPPDLQGRVFAASGQLMMVLRPIAFASAGLLADHVFEPAVGARGWSALAPLFGEQTGAGMGLLASFGGMVIVALGAIGLALPSLRHLERDLPDYPSEPSAADVLSEPDGVTAGELALA